MSNVKNKKNRPQGYVKGKACKGNNGKKRPLKVGNGEGFRILRKGFDFYSDFDFVVEKMESLWSQVPKLCRWARDVLIKQEQWVPVIFWMVFFLILVCMIFILQKITYSKSIGKTGKREGFTILARFIKFYSTFDFAVKKMKSLWPQVSKLCRWARDALTKKKQWIPAIICLLILLVLICIIFIIHNISKKIWIIQVKLYLYRMEGYLWQTNIHLWLEVLMCYYLPP